MIRNIFILVGDVLDLRIFRFLNQVVAAGVRLSLPSLLRTLILPAKFRRVSSFFVRGSLLKPIDYNPFYSDWDIGLSVDDSTLSSGEFAELCSLVTTRLARLRKAIPAIGEIEIYTNIEKAELDEFFLRHEFFYIEMRSLRKIKWIEDSGMLESASSYHKRKAHRSIGVCYQRLNSRPQTTDPTTNWHAALRSVLQRKFRNLTLAEDDADQDGGRDRVWDGRDKTYYHAYLDRPVVGRLVPWPHLVQLFAACPPLVVPDAELAEYVSQARSENETRQLCFDFSRAESLILTGVLRAATKENPGLQQWHQSLKTCEEAMNRR